MEEDVPTTHDITTEFATYEEFLDNQITTLDLFYLEVFQFSTLIKTYFEILILKG